MSREPVNVSSSTVLSRAGTVAGVATALWMAVSLPVQNAVAGLIGAGDVPLLLEFVVALLPGIIVLAAGPLSRRSRSFLWLLARPQPSATIDDEGIEVCLPDRGCQRFGWEEVGRMTAGRLHGWRRLTTTVEPCQLRAPDGRVLIEVPSVLAAPASERRWRNGRSLAEVVVARLPDRFALLRPSNPFSGFTTFGLVAEAPTPAEMDAIKRRRRLIQRMVALVMVVLTVAGFFAVAGSPF